LIVLGAEFLTVKPLHSANSILVSAPMSGRANSISVSASMSGRALRTTEVQEPETDTVPAPDYSTYCTTVRPVEDQAQQHQLRDHLG
jgi:hypothetical protein